MAVALRITNTALASPCASSVKGVKSVKNEIAVRP